MGVIQSYFTPVIMAIFFYLLPILFRFLSKQQGYWTQTTLDRKVLVKLYIFFIINNLLVFTLTSMFIGKNEEVIDDEKDVEVKTRRLLMMKKM